MRNYEKLLNEKQAWQYLYKVGPVRMRNFRYGVMYKITKQLLEIEAREKRKNEQYSKIQYKSMDQRIAA